MPPEKSIGVQGKVLHGQTREVIANVLNFMKKEASDGLQIDLKNFKARLLAATKIGENSYRRIAKDCKDVETGKTPAFTSPPRKKRKRSRPKSDLSEEALEVIRSVILEFPKTENRQPTLQDIYNKVVAVDVGFTGGKTTLWAIIKKLGFRWKKTVDNKSVIVESSLKRKKYLQQLQGKLQVKHDIIYIDEPHIQSTHSKRSTCDAPQTVKISQTTPTPTEGMLCKLLDEPSSCTINFS